MKKNLLLFCCLTGLGLFFLVLVTNSQATMTTLTLSHLINEAQNICYGQVTDLKSEWDEKGNFIYTTVNLSVFESMKGKASPTLSIKMRGGVVDDIGQSNSNSPVFWPNEKVIVFVDPESGLVGDYQGKFHVSEDLLVTERGLPLNALLAEIKDIQSGKVEGNFSPRPAGQNSPVSTGYVTGPTGSVSTAYTLTPYRWCQPNPMGEDFYINNKVSEDQKSAFLAAALTWNESGACFKFSYGGDTPTSGTVFDGVNVIYWGGGLDNKTLAETTYWFNNTTGCMLEVDCEFNENLAWSTTGEPSTYDVQTGMLHEFGHYLSLDHSKNPDAVMYPYYSGVKRSLSEDDRDGIKKIYGDCEGGGGGGEPAWDSTYPLTVGSPANLSLLREYRDQVLCSRPNGEYQVRYLYSQSNELLRVLLSNPKLILKAQQIMEKNLPEIQKAVKHQEATLQDPDAIYTFLNDLAASKSLKTKTWLNGLARELKRCQQSGRKFYGFQVTETSMRQEISHRLEINRRLERRK